ncbi:MAG: helix-turn-helix domain-containing protein, partial [Geobacteraceae bacterium]
KTGAPIMVLFDLLGRRWAMGIIWNLNKGPAPFQVLKAKCETISPTILSTRLKELTEAHIIERTLDGYRLTDEGHELFVLLKPLGDWSKKWATSIK